MMRTQLHIGEVAQLLGVTPKTIRHYQKVGLLADPARTEAGYRLYSAQDLLRLQRIRRLQALGLSLKQIKVVLGDPTHEHTLRQILQSLDQELGTQIALLEERRKKIRTLLDEPRLDVFEAKASPSPTFQRVQEQLVAHHFSIDPAQWEQEAQLYALLDDFQWFEGQPTGLKELADRFIQHVTEHPEEYQQLLALGERLTALASLPEDAPEVEQLVEDFDGYFEHYPFLLNLQKQIAFADQESPISQIFGDLMTPIFSPAQRRFSNELARRRAKEGPS
jgi:DNA-binding transcriptional MerR regulator